MICGVQEMMGSSDTAMLKLQTNRPVVMIQDALPNHDRDTIWNWIEEGFRRWATYADIIPTRVDIQNESQIPQGSVLLLVTVSTPQQANWPSGVLADQRLPHQGGIVLPMRINSAIQWAPTDGPMRRGTIDPLRTLTHELGHFLGHQHWPVGDPSELMEPTISQTIIGPQPTEGKVSAGWFGPAKPKTPIPTEQDWKVTGSMPFDLKCDPSGKFILATRGGIVVSNNGEKYVLTKSPFKHVA